MMSLPWLLLAFLASAARGQAEPACTAQGKPCVFPFNYEGKEYTACTLQDDESAWCGLMEEVTSDDGDWEATLGITWEYCDDPNCSAESTPTPATAEVTTPKKSESTCTGTASGRPCVFPFKFPDDMYNITHTSCYDFYGTGPVCAIEVDENDVTNNVIDFCGADCTEENTPTPSTAEVTTTKKSEPTCTGTATGRPCVFPFKFAEDMNHTHTACVYMDDGAGPFCATEVDENNVMQSLIERCSPGCAAEVTSTTSSTPEVITTAESDPTCTASGKPCIFPFSDLEDNYYYEDLPEYTQCINRYGNGTMWCATEVDENNIMTESGVCDASCSETMPFEDCTAVEWDAVPSDLTYEYHYDQKSDLECHDFCSKYQNNVYWGFNHDSMVCYCYQLVMKHQDYFSAGPTNCK